MSDEFIDIVISYLQHPLEIMLLGLALFFALKWGVMRNNKKIPEGGFWNDQKDEIVIALIVGLLVLVLDDEAISAYYSVVEPFMVNTIGIGEIVPEENRIKEMELWMYAFIGPIAERIYWLYQAYQKLKGSIKIQIKEDD